MSKNECVDRVLEELERYGLRGTINDRGKHLEIAWQYPDGRQRQFFTACTPSDWRGSLNARSDVRKMLRADGIQLPASPVISFHKAMSLPRPPIAGLTKEQILQKDVDALADLVFELSAKLSETQDRLNNMKVVTTVTFEKASEVVVSVEEQPKVEQPQVVQKYVRGSSKQLVLDQMPVGQWVATAALVKTLGKENKAVINQALMRLRKEGLVENGQRGFWRRKVQAASVAS